MRYNQRDRSESIDYSVINSAEWKSPESLIYEVICSAECTYNVAFPQSLEAEVG